MTTPTPALRSAHSRFLEAYNKAAQSSLPADWHEAALLAKQFEYEVAPFLAPAPVEQARGVATWIREAAEEAARVYRTPTPTSLYADAIAAIIIKRLPPAVVPDKILVELANGFLRWSLPDSVCADPCACGRGYKNRVGTNLLSYPEALAMMREVVGPRLAHFQSLATGNKDSINTDDGFSKWFETNRADLMHRSTLAVAASAYRAARAATGKGQTL